MEEIDLNSKTPKETLEILGSIIEEAREDKDLEKLKTSIDIAKEINLDVFDTHSKAIFYYYLGNAWSYIVALKYPDSILPMESDEIENEIIALRKALMLIEECDDNFNKCQILTNLGSLFSHIGRFSEAQEYYNLCLEIQEDFGMAIGNKGFGLFRYARLIFEPNHQFIFMQYARKYLLQSIDLGDVYVEAKEKFYSLAKHIESAHSAELLDDFKEYEDQYKDLKSEEIEYREWCANNNLFINPLNDILTSSVVANDYLFIPNMVMGVNEKPIYHTMFNQIKQEFVSARYLFFESLNGSNEIHFSDKEVVLMDTLDYCSYSITLEKAKIAFRICYSIFDKISYFINLYLKLDNNPNRVTFRNVWYNKLNQKKGLNEMFSNSENEALKGLFWLSKDLYEPEFDLTIEPEAKEIAKIRNYIEHKSFKVVESLNPDWTEETTSYEIDRDLFIYKTMKVIRLSRYAIMYLTFLMYSEESERTDKRGDGIIMPVDFIGLKDEYKT
ncbi:LA2681 family HEPN domain-containing protein [Labilibaculum euxinus]